MSTLLDAILVLKNRCVKRVAASIGMTTKSPTSGFVDHGIFHVEGNSL